MDTVCTSLSKEIQIMLSDEFMKGLATGIILGTLVVGLVIRKIVD